jgi:hypothetical protein
MTVNPLSAPPLIGKKIGKGDLQKDKNSGLWLTTREITEQNQ